MDKAKSLFKKFWPVAILPALYALGDGIVKATSCTWDDSLWRIIRDALGSLIGG